MHNLMLFGIVSPLLSVLLEHLIPLVVGVLGLLITPFIALLASAVKKKWGFEIDQAKEDKLHDVIVNAIGKAEQWAVNKTASTGTKPAGAQKLEHALDFAETEVKRLGLDVKARDYLEKLIEAKLGVAKL